MDLAQYLQESVAYYSHLASVLAYAGAAIAALGVAFSFGFDWARVALESSFTRESIARRTTRARGVRS